MKSKRNRKSKFFLILGIIGLFAVLAGFLKPFILPVTNGNFKAPLIIYVHGLFAAIWVILFVIQSTLIQTNKLKVHKELGYLGLAIALGAAITIIPVSLYQVKRELDLGLDQTAVSGIVGAVTTAIMFLSLVAAAVILRFKAPAHKRLMALATIVLLWPAWFRFRHLFPSVPNPEIWFAVVLADSFIILAIFWDLIINKKVHWVFLYVGPVIILEHTVEVILFDSKPWRQIANFLYYLFN